MTRKTAISIDEVLFRKAEKLAKEMRVSRSHLIAQAVEDYLKKHENLRLLHQLNRAYGDGLDDEERKVLKYAARRMREVSRRDGY
jgi:metal-responsive CopG/Arc/MetJ family transcriptional regulator